MEDVTCLAIITRSSTFQQPKLSRFHVLVLIEQDGPAWEVL